MNIFRRFRSLSAVIVVLCAVGVTSDARASVTYYMDTGFNGTPPDPNSGGVSTAGPWATLRFYDNADTGYTSLAANVVLGFLTLNMPSSTGAKISDLALNVTPDSGAGAITAALLSISQTGLTGFTLPNTTAWNSNASVATTAAPTLQSSTIAINTPDLPGGGNTGKNYDILLSWDVNGTSLFQGAKTAAFTITRTVGTLTASSFIAQNPSGRNASVHIQGYPAGGFPSISGAITGTLQAPEPASFVLLGSGLAGLAILRRRRAI